MNEYIISASLREAPFLSLYKLDKDFIRVDLRSFVVNNLRAGVDCFG